MILRLSPKKWNFKKFAKNIRKAFKNYSLYFPQVLKDALSDAIVKICKKNLVKAPIIWVHRGGPQLFYYWV